MQYFPPALENLVEQFARLPGVGVKSAQRLAFHVLSLPRRTPPPLPRPFCPPSPPSTAVRCVRI